MELENLELEVKRSRYFVLAAAVTPALLYLLWFVAVNDQKLSTDAARWGTFGDFVGGLINPLIAFFAFYWLTKSVLIQKTELSETKTALQETQRAQEAQARIALKTAQLQSLNIRLSAVNHKISHERDYMRYILSEYQRLGGSYTIMTRDGTAEKGEAVLSKTHAAISTLMQEQEKLIEMVEALE
ncbi:hypothetical protein [Azotobacter chroococcum]|uniref:hypothetical protein n=1 Tax=Azotobacter chroococcum TaxID=353 RepID=UPI00197AAB32|nr:hypothetical protein [Azotobacter chroococcum]